MNFVELFIDQVNKINVKRQIQVNCDKEILQNKLKSLTYGEYNQFSRFMILAINYLDANRLDEFNYERVNNNFKSVIANTSSFNDFIDYVCEIVEKITIESFMKLIHKSTVHREVKEECDQTSIECSIETSEYCDQAANKCCEPSTDCCAKATEECAEK